MSAFDYSSPADFYSGRRTRGRSSVRYRRFDSAAEALRFMVEDMPVEQLTGAILEVDEERFEGTQITALYENASYPLARA